jgi:hypothetical protein
VAQVIDDHTLVVNRGSEHGVGIGMRFAVLNAKGAEITDPETGESIGSVDIDKVIVKVVRVEPRLAVARTFQRFATGFGALFGGMRTETLRIEDSTYKQDLDEKDSYVKIGDPVVEVIGDEFVDRE